MKKLSTYLLTIFIAMFWVFRIITALLYSLGIDFITVPMDLNYEIIMLFLTLVIMILVIKRNVLGGILYLIGNGLYFGTSIYNMIINKQNVNYLEAIICLVGVILPVAVLFDLLLDKNRREHPVDKKTDWFYKNKDYDRKLDERADKNQYKF